MRNERRRALSSNERRHLAAVEIRYCAVRPATQPRTPPCPTTSSTATSVPPPSRHSRPCEAFYPPLLQAFTLPLTTSPPKRRIAPPSPFSCTASSASWTTCRPPSRSTHNASQPVSNSSRLSDRCRLRTSCNGIGRWAAPLPPFSPTFSTTMKSTLCTNP
eukprot:365276-Chlamydomonas_euryale.AAC.19